MQCFRICRPAFFRYSFFRYHMACGMQACGVDVPRGLQVKLLQLGGLPLPHDGHRQDEDVHDLHSETHGHECCTAAVLVAPASRGPVPGRASHGRTGAASQSFSRYRACSAEAAIVRLTHARERVPPGLPGGLAGWGTPPRSGPLGLRSRSREVGCIQAEAHGAQHPGVLYFSLRLKLLASEAAPPSLLPTTQPVLLGLAQDPLWKGQLHEWSLMHR